MAKSKDSLALFEVFGRKPQMPVGIAIPHGQNSATPGQLPPASTATSAEAASASREGAPEAPAGSASATAVATETQAPADVQAPSSDEPTPPPLPEAPVDNPRIGITSPASKISLSMTLTGWAIAGGSAVLLLVCVFLLGRLSVPKTPDVGPIGPGASTAGANGGATGGGEAAAPKRIVGKYYLVIQGISAKSDKTEKWKDAEAIRDFLKNNGVKADIRELNETYLVWSLDAMDSPSDAKASEYVKKIEDLGKKYMAAKGGYNFSQKSAQPWYIRATAE